MTSLPKVLYLGQINLAVPEWKAAMEELDVLHVQTGTRAQFLNDCRSGVYDDFKAIARTAESLAITGRFDPELVECLPASIKFIAHSQAGYDSIDIPACTKRGIAVSNTPSVGDQSVADLTLFLLLGALRHQYRAGLSTKSNLWRTGYTLGHQAGGKTLGILGMGGIGSGVARRAAAFGMKIQYHNRHPLPADKLPAGIDVSYVPFDHLVQTSDVISLHLPLSDATRHTLGAAEFAQMKDGVVIVNTSRGPVIDEQALADALVSGKVFGAGLDVYENEPVIHPELLKNDHAVLSPHVGSGTFEAMKATEVLVLENVKSALKTGKLITQVHEQMSK